MESTKFLLSEKDIPTAWYNIQASMPNRPKPVLHPGTGKPIGPEDLEPFFPMQRRARSRPTGSGVAMKVA